MDIAVRGVLMNCPKQRDDGLMGLGSRKEAKWDLTVVTPKLEPLNYSPSFFLMVQRHFFLPRRQKRMGPCTSHPISDVNLFLALAA
jgi:hypothetical protein